MKFAVTDFFQSIQMQRTHQLVFVSSLLAVCWLGMMATHELGHVIGALLTQGTVERVVLHPLSISRTDVSPNPCPSIVVWLGPIIGCVIPAVVCVVIPRKNDSLSRTSVQETTKQHMLRNIAIFFTGFCLLTNGAYIAIGSFDRVGDCGEMLRHGSPRWTLIAFGAITIPLGIYVWHRLGSIKQFIGNPSLVDARSAYAMLLILLIIVGCEFTFSAS